MNRIETVYQFREALEFGRFAWPGGYPRYFIMKDCEPLSFEAAEQNFMLIEHAIMNHDDPQWEVVAVDVNWEDNTLICSHTNKPIEVAYDNEVAG
jgi:hypothetical protein